MILVDANILLYAHASGSPHHERARSWLEEKLNAADPVGLPWNSLLAFIRVISSPRLTVPAESLQNAWKQVEEWLDSPVVWIPQPTERHREVLRSLFSSVVNNPRLVPDAHLAALAIEHGLILCSADGDFARFREVRWLNPLE